jgi:uncharacterized membrane protein
VTISFSVWSMIGWTVEVVLVLLVVILLRLWHRAGAAFRELQSDQARAERVAREKFGQGGS